MQEASVPGTNSSQSPRALAPLAAQAKQQPTQATQSAVRLHRAPGSYGSGEGSFHRPGSAQPVASEQVGALHSAQQLR